jgi:hypothetical protein
VAGGIVTEKASFSVSLAVGLAAVIAGSLISVARADLIVSDDQVSVIPSDVARPSPGMTMQKVEQKYGAPAERHAAVGTPPITRWDYQNFAVFFENDRVIHAVVTADAAMPAAEPTSAPAN